MGLMGCAMHALVNMMFDKAGVADMTGYSGLLDRAALYVFLCLVVLGVFVSLHQAAIFLRVVEETSAGVDEMVWGKDPWFEYIGKWLFLAWIGIASSGLWAILVLPVMHALPIPRPRLVSLFCSAGSLSRSCSFHHGGQCRLDAAAPPLLWHGRSPRNGVSLVNGLFLFRPRSWRTGSLANITSLLLFAGPIWAISLLAMAGCGRVGFELIREDGRGCASDVLGSLAVQPLPQPEPGGAAATAIISYREPRHHHARFPEGAYFVASSRILRIGWMVFGGARRAMSHANASTASRVASAGEHAGERPAASRRCGRSCQDFGQLRPDHQDGEPARASSPINRWISALARRRSLRGLIQNQHGRPVASRLPRLLRLPPENRRRVHRPRPS